MLIIGGQETPSIVKEANEFKVDTTSTRYAAATHDTSARLKTAAQLFLGISPEIGSKKRPYRLLTGLQARFYPYPAVQNFIAVEASVCT